MNQEVITDRRLRQYLLATLPEGERTRVEEEYFADDHGFEELLAAENELIDAYVAGELTAAERDRFAQAFLTTAARRNRVAFARTLQTAVAGTATRPTATAPARTPWSSAIAGWLRTPPVVPRWGMAAAVIALVAGVSWLALQRAQLQDAVDRLESEHTGLVRQTQGLQQQVDEERRRAATRTVDQPAPEARTPIIASLLLTPGFVRGGSDANAIRIGPGVALLRLELELESSSHPRYRPLLATPSGEEVWSQRAVAADATGAAPRVTIELPASLLTNRDYILTLSGVSADGQSEEVAAYSFRVLRQ